MSSMEIRGELPKKRPTFLRSTSFERLKCSAATHFQIAGSTFSKTSLAQLFEWVISKARSKFHATILFLILPLLRAVCECTLWFIDLLTMLIGFNLILEETSSKLKNQCQCFVIKIQHIRSKKLARLTTSKSSVIPAINNESTVNLTTIPKENVEQSDIITPIKRTNEGNNTISPSLLLITKEQLLMKKPKTSAAAKSNGFLIFGVYGSAIFVYLEFMILVIGLQSAYTPPGLVFLLISLAYIGYIIHKVLSNKKINSAKSKTQPKSTTKSTPARFRLSQFTTRKLIDFHNKTLSKIQLL